MINLFSNINIPFYIVITFFLAYIIWSKFLKDDKLAPKNIDDILNLFNIFICLFIFSILTVIYLTSIIMILLDLSNLGLLLQKIYYGAPIMVANFSLLGIWLFAGYYVNKKCSKDDLNKIFNFIIGYLVLLIVSFSPTICFFILYTPLFYFLNDIIFISFIVLFLILICYLTSNNLFEINLRTLIFNKLTLRITLIMTIIITSVFWSSIPQFNYSELIYEDYQMYGLDSAFGEAYLHAKILIDIETFGLIGSYVPLIEIPYEQYDFETEGDAGKNFRILINSTKKDGTTTLIDGFDEIKNFQKKTENKFSFLDAILIEDKGVLLLQFNPDTIRDEDIKTIILEGYIKKNMTELDYSYDSTDYCNAEGCNLTFNIKNNLDLPVYHNEHTIVNLNNRDITNKSKCRLTYIASDYPTDDNISERGNYCSGTFCELDIIDVPFDKTIFALKVFLHEDVVRLKFIDIKKPIDINVQADLIC